MIADELAGVPFDIVDDPEGARQVVGLRLRSGVREPGRALIDLHRRLTHLAGYYGVRSVDLPFAAADRPVWEESFGARVRLGRPVGLLRLGAGVLSAPVGRVERSTLAWRVREALFDRLGGDPVPPDRGCDRLPPAAARLSGAIGSASSLSSARVPATRPNSAPGPGPGLDNASGSATNLNGVPDPAARLNGVPDPAPRLNGVPDPASRASSTPGPAFPPGRVSGSATHPNGAPGPAARLGGGPEAATYLGGAAGRTTRLNGARHPAARPAGALVPPSRLWEHARPERTVRHMLPDDVGGPAPTLGEIARWIAVHPRTLQRALADEGLTFAEILDCVRRERARELVATTDLPFAEVSARLGFAEPAVLTRCARRWWGRTPSQMRAGDPASPVPAATVR